MKMLCVYAPPIVSKAVVMEYELGSRVNDSTFFDGNDFELSAMVPATSPE
jgi:hypothetical protein